MANEIHTQFTLHGKQLPVGLSELQSTAYKDPVTGKPLEYFPKPPAGYAVFTSFDTQSPKEELNGALAFWIHSAGRKCYEFEASEAIPQVPYNEYQESMTRAEGGARLRG